MHGSPSVAACCGLLLHFRKASEGLASTISLDWSSSAWLRPGTVSHVVITLERKTEHTSVILRIQYVILTNSLD